MEKAMEKTFECKDLMISAALLSRGVGLKDTKNTGGFVTFVFEDPKRCRKIEKQWWQGTLKVTAPRFADAIKRCKSIIYGSKRRH